MTIDFTDLNDAVHEDFALDTLSITRGGVTTSDVGAIPEGEPFSFTDSDALQIEDGDTVYRIKIADYIISEAAVRPIKGDEYTNANGEMFDFINYSVDPAKLNFLIAMRRNDL